MLTRGQAILEMILVLALTCFVASAVLLASYFLFAKIWATYQSDRMLFCLAESGPDCRHQALVQLNRFLPLGRVSLTANQVSEEEWRSVLRWSYLGRTPHLTFEVRRSLRPDSRRWR